MGERGHRRRTASAGRGRVLNGLIWLIWLKWLIWVDKGVWSTPYDLENKFAGFRGGSNSAVQFRPVTCLGHCDTAVFENAGPLVGIY